MMNKLKGKWEMGNVENTITQVSQASKLGEVSIEKRDSGSVSRHTGYKEIRKSDFKICFRNRISLWCSLRNKETKK